MRIPVKVGNPPTAIDVPVDAWVVEAPVLTKITQGEKTVAQGLALVRQQTPAPDTVSSIPDKSSRAPRDQQQASRSRSTSAKKSSNRSKAAPAKKTTTVKKNPERGSKRKQPHQFPIESAKRLHLEHQLPTGRIVAVIDGQNTDHDPFGNPQEGKMNAVEALCILVQKVFNFTEFRDSKVYNIRELKTIQSVAVVYVKAPVLCYIVYPDIMVEREVPDASYACGAMAVDWTENGVVRDERLHSGLSAMVLHRWSRLCDRPMPTGYAGIMTRTIKLTAASGQSVQVIESYFKYALSFPFYCLKNPVGYILNQFQLNIYPPGAWFQDFTGYWYRICDEKSSSTT